MKKTLAIILALLLCMTMLLSACGGPEATPGGNDETGGISPQPDATDPPQGTDAAPVPAEAPAYVTEPITIEFWHTMSGSTNGALIEEQIKRFNETNEYGITVVGTYQGGYYDVLTKIKSSYNAGIAPAIAIVGAGGIEELASAGALADVSAYVERDQFDMENIPEALRFYSEHYEGQIIEFPYLVSTNVIYYNKALLKQEPASIQEWVEMAKDITAAHPGVYGMGITLDAGYTQRPILMTLGAPGLTDESGENPATLDDGSLTTLMNDWNSWIHDGFCMGLNVTSSTNMMLQAFYNGTLASFTSSSGAYGTIHEAASSAGIDLGVARLVGYDGYCAAIGGGGLAIMANATQQETAAAWEFIKFLLDDAQVLELHKQTGYLPFTVSASQAPELETFWQENPGYKVSCEQLEYATYNNWSLHLEEWRDQITNAFTAVLVDGTMTADEAVSFLKRQASVIF